tara:strand:+ start:87 stop:398 length:312 start_codon:yes stop_codon:yes gene_type:complete
MSPQVKATLQAFSEYFHEFEDAEDFNFGPIQMCYEIDQERDDGSIIGRTMVYSGHDKDGNPMVRDEGVFEVNADGEIMKCDGLARFTCNYISDKGLEIYEEEH